MRMPFPIFNSIYSAAEVKINPQALILTVATSLVLGIILAMAYKRQTIYTKGFVVPFLYYQLSFQSLSFW